MMDTPFILNLTRQWLEKAVIGLNLCPFAKAVHLKRQIRYVVSPATSTGALRATLEQELLLLQQSEPETIDTTLLIHPWVLQDFHAHNDFLDTADRLLCQLGLEGEIQIASFHPQYQFADAPTDAIDNYTNRAPFPILHLLREASIEQALARFPDPASIYQRNIQTLRQLGEEGWQRLKVEPPALP